jgi:hypothetical protein
MSKKPLPRVEHQVVAHFHRGPELIMLKGQASPPPGVEATAVESLPLIVTPPGWCKFGDRYYNLREEGLYRFWDWGEAHWTTPGQAPTLSGNPSYSCVIVFKRHVLRLLGALALSQYHGNRHHSLTFDEKLAHLKTGVLSLTCGPSSEFARQVLEQQGWQARGVNTVRVRGEWTTWNNGHVMFEFYWPEQRKWVLADVNAHRMFVQNGLYLSAGEAMEIVRRGEQFEFEWLTLRGVGMVDCSSGILGEYPGYLASEHGFSDDELMRASLGELLQQVLLPDEGALWFYPARPAHARRLQQYNPSVRQISREDWWRRFYQQDPPE